LVEQHLESTGSANARRVLAEWPGLLAKFVKVAPVDYKRIIRERALQAGEHDLEAVSGG
jgi:glutamate synthase domain-containing protein 3